MMLSSVFSTQIPTFLPSTRVTCAAPAVCNLISIHSIFIIHFPLSTVTSKWISRPILWDQYDLMCSIDLKYGTDYLSKEIRQSFTLQLARCLFFQLKSKQGSSMGGGAVVQPMAVLMSLCHFHVRCFCFSESVSVQTCPGAHFVYIWGP